MTPGERQAVEAYLAVGSNIDPRSNVVRAVEALSRRLPLTGVSTFWRTVSIGPDGEPDGQPDFVNGVVRVLASCDARTLKFGILDDIERMLGRDRSGPRGRYVPRPIDLDLVVFGDSVIDEPDLRIPSRDVGRPFVAAGLVELDPEMVLPGSGEVLGCLWPGGSTAAGMVADAELSAKLKEYCSQ